MADAPPATTRPPLPALALATLGVVFGDIGTSPLYAFRQCFVGIAGARVTPEEVLGILSLITWALLLVVSVKYLAFVLNADNRGEGGILALLALSTPLARRARAPRGARLAILIGVFGAALLYGDGMITPAISVLSAVDGLRVATPQFQPWIVPITLIILIALFSVQRFGTHRISAVFGPVMVLWFTTLAVLGAFSIARHPEVLSALNPIWAIEFLGSHSGTALLVLGAVVLTVTGCEALYADLGHFGARPIRLAWYGFVLPALLLNYFGQGAHVLATRRLGAHPFFEMAPDWALYPLIGLATVATIIASQALITGAFSLTRQAIRLGFLPRMRIVHTSGHERGQIFLPGVNRGLMIACLMIVVGFRTPEALADAYGVAVTGTMLITTVLYFRLLRRRWEWSLPLSLLVLALFLAIDLPFAIANLGKIPTGGWLPLLVAAGGLVLMTTWRKGRILLAEKVFGHDESATEFLAEVENTAGCRIDGTAVYLTGDTRGIPATLVRNFRAHRVVHERVILLSMLVVDAAWVDDEERVTVTEMTHGITRVVSLFGFMERQDVARALTTGAARELELDPASLLYFQGVYTLRPVGSGGMARWRKRLFALLARNAFPAVGYLEIPPERTFGVAIPQEL